ncbi:MAG: kinase/pyrophosphorylase [Desulfuromonadales bacterium]|nr:kinase/pyrophosphorylase [Desulfuromonadales bacterium]
MNNDICNIYLFSDATGETAERVVKAAISQFQNAKFKLNLFNQMRSKQEISAGIIAALKNPGLIIYTFVNHDLAEFFKTESEILGLETIDILNPLLEKLSKILDIKPREKPGLLYEIDTTYHKRMEAIDFTVKQDDGQELRYLYKADIILIGVSRTSKTPLSMYLANKGYKVANIPIVKNIDLPAELFKINPKRVVGLLIDPARLAALRTTRLMQLKQVANNTYANYDEIIDELAFCKKLYKQNPDWLVIDVTSKSVEESAGEIIKKIQYIE